MGSAIQNPSPELPRKVVIWRKCTYTRNKKPSCR